MIGSDACFLVRPAGTHSEDMEICMDAMEKCPLKK